MAILSIIKYRLAGWAAGDEALAVWGPDVPSTFLD